MAASARRAARAPSDEPGEGADDEPGQQGHVVAGEGDDVGRAGRVEVVRQVLRQGGAFAEEDALRQRGLRLRQGACQRRRQVAAQVSGSPPAPRFPWSGLLSSRPPGNTAMETMP